MAVSEVAQYTLCSTSKLSIKHGHWHTPSEAEKEHFWYFSFLNTFQWQKTIQTYLKVWLQRKDD